MKMHSSLVYSLLAMLLSGTCSAKQTAIPELTAKESCQEQIIKTPNLTAADWPRRARGREVNGYVVIAYTLDGSGKAAYLEITASVPKGLFDKTTRSLLERTEFRPGVYMGTCTYVRTYGTVKRSVL